MRMIFYHPAPIQENASSASGIRPFKMLSAFKRAGFEVDTVCGYPPERATSIRTIKKNVAKGVEYDFVYGENTTYPFSLCDPDHNPKYLFLDYSFWIWLKRKKIPYGCFYRDIYWKFPEFHKAIPIIKRLIFRVFYYMDVLFLKRTTKILFLPSREMALHVPFNFKPECIEPLPPGCDIKEGTYSLRANSDAPINVFYAGGILPPAYNLEPMLSFFSSQTGRFRLTICCREAEWDVVVQKGVYNEINSPNIRIVHKNGPDLEEEWLRSSLFLALWERITYRDFAVPFKIFEALGYGVPVITTSDTEAGNFVEANNLGWSINPTAEELKSLLEKIQQSPGLLKEKRSAALSIQKNHTWEARAARVAELLAVREADTTNDKK